MKQEYYNLIDQVEGLLWATSRDQQNVKENIKQMWVILEGLVATVELDKTKELLKKIEKNYE